jgi:hypothetical protein
LADTAPQPDPTDEPADETPDTESADEPDGSEDLGTEPTTTATPARVFASSAEQESNMPPTVADMLADDNRLIRKHGTQFLAIADFSDPIPATWFTAGLPTALPAAYRNMGYISTDGVQESNDIGASDVNAVQDLDPVRSDVDSRSKTLQVTFLEASGYTMGLAHWLPVDEWPTDKTAAWEFHDGERTDAPYYRLALFTQDGVGDDAVYRVEFAYRAKVTDMGDRTLNRTDAESLQFTFTCYKDPVVGRTTTKASTAAVAAVTP